MTTTTTTASSSLLVEHGNRARNPYDNQRLTRQHRKDNGTENRRKQHLVDAKLHVCLVEHVEGEGQSRQNTI